MKTVGLVDFVWNGHHPTYYRLFAETLLKEGCQIVAFYDNKPHPFLEDLYLQDRSYKQRLHLVALPPNSSGPLWLPWSLRKYIVNFCHFYTTSLAIKKVINHLGCNFDLIFFNSIYDASAVWPHMVDTIFPYPWSGLALSCRAIRQQTAYHLKGFNDPYSAFRSRNCQAVCVLDSGSSLALSSHLSDKLVLDFPDITDRTPPNCDFAVVKTLRELSKNRHIVACLGSLDKRKGVLRLLEISELMQGLDVFFLFAGEFSGYGYSELERERIKNMAKNRPENCFFYLGAIKDGADFNSLVYASDIIFLAYEDFTNSSNLLTKAAVFHKPVIAHREYYIGEMVIKYELGITVIPGDVEGYINAINALCKSPPHSLAGFNEYAELHSMNRVLDVFKELLSVSADKQRYIT